MSKAPGAFDVSPSSSLQPSRTWLRARMMFLLGTAGQQEAQEVPLSEQQVSGDGRILEDGAKVAL